MKYKNIAAELLRKLLNDEIKIRTRWNLVEEKKSLRCFKRLYKIMKAISVPS